MSSAFIAFAGLLYVGATVGFLRHAQWPEAVAWGCYSAANFAFAWRAYLQGN